MFSFVGILVGMDGDEIVDAAIERVERWIATAKANETDQDRAVTKPLHDLIEDPSGVTFAMEFIDRVLRPDDDTVAAHQLTSLMSRSEMPSFLSSLDRNLLRLGARVAPYLPAVVLPLARKRIRSIVGHLIVDARPGPRSQHLQKRRNEGFDLNVNLLGELVLGESEADGRLRRTMDLLSQPDVDYVSVKLSSVAAQLDYWSWDESLERVVERLIPVFELAASFEPPKFVNLDMEEYHDLELTVAAFKAILSEPSLHALTAGIVLQAYLPDAYEALQDLVAWATERKERGGSEIRIRLVKGANLAMEHVEAALAGWEQAPYESKADTDANYKQCVDWALTPERTEAVQIGVASHNLFDVAWADLLSRERGVEDRVSFEMLQGMVPAQARLVQNDNGSVRLYTPVVAPDDFDSAIGYLFRRLEENSEHGNFMKVVFDMAPGSEAFAEESRKFRQAVRERHTVSTGPRRSQQRPALGTHMSIKFENEPDSDPALANVREWARTVVNTLPDEPRAAITDSVAEIDAVLGRAAAATWVHTPVDVRASILREVGNELARRRGDLISAMVHEGKKTFDQADPEVSEAIDFATYYSQRCTDLEADPAAKFDPLGTVVIVPPWNFPVAIPTGGTMAALAAGNAVVLKPAPETPRCAEIIAEACWQAGVPQDALQFVRTPDNEVGQHLVTSADGVILTGSVDTADLFRSWKPSMKLFAETSGKNALIITEHADIDLAVADLAASAFGHSGQKCSAASLAICVGETYTSDRFRRQLIDAVDSLHLGVPSELTTTMGPTISEPSPHLLKALTSLEAGEEWLVEPRQLGPDFWSPGIKTGVRAGSWFHTTECFGPVLGIMHAATLEEAITIQNSGSFGLTGGIHTLDPAEIDEWLDRVEIGNAYVNRVITGAIVQRQPFGGWKRSAIGPGAKAGGPNYVAQLGTWTSREVTDYAVNDRQAWEAEFSQEHDPTGLFCEANIFRYRPLDSVGLWHDSRSDQSEIKRVRSAAATCGVPLVEPVSDEDESVFVRRLGAAGIERVRVLGSLGDATRTEANRLEVHVADSPVTASGRIELQHYVREQAVSRTLHRFGNVGRI